MRYALRTISLAATPCRAVISLSTRALGIDEVLVAERGFFPNNYKVGADRLVGRSFSFVQLSQSRIKRSSEQHLQKGQ
jgi:hypothetical protein